VTRSAVQTSRLFKSPKSRVATVTASRMSAPPIDGVPVFFWCDSGVSSRTFEAPYCRVRMRSMK